MRDIKFRFWNKEGKCMYDVSELNFALYSPNIIGATTKNDNYYTLDEIDVLQYTEIKDKNGEEIFEGDIIQYVNEFYKPAIKRYLVIFKDGSFRAKQICNKEHIPLEFLASFKDKDIKIIGNKYQNPELLIPKEEKYVVKFALGPGLTVFLKKTDGDIRIAKAENGVLPHLDFCGLTEKEIKDSYPFLWELAEEIKEDQNV